MEKCNIDIDEERVRNYIRVAIAQALLKDKQMMILRLNHETETLQKIIDSPSDIQSICNEMGVVNDEG